MTNSSLSSALRAACLSCLALLAGCGCGSGGGTVEPSSTDPADYAPDDVPRIQLEAAEALARGELDAADAAFARLADDAELPPAARSVGWVGRGVVVLRRAGASGETTISPDVARCCYMRALCLDGNNASAHYNLADLYRRNFKFDRAAFVRFGNYLALAPDASDPHVARAREAVSALKSEAKSRRGRKDAGALSDGTKDAAFLRDCKALAAFPWDERAWNDEGTARAYRELLASAMIGANRTKHPVMAASLCSRSLAERPPSDAATVKVLVRALKAAGLAERAAVYEKYLAFLQGGK